MEKKAFIISIHKNIGTSFFSVIDSRFEIKMEQSVPVNYTFNKLMHIKEI